MKQFVLLLILPFMISCAALNKDKGPYDGEWVLVSKSGGFMGKVSTPDKELSIKIKNNEIKYYENGTLKQTKEFKTEKGKTIHSSEPQDIIVGNTIPKQSIRIHDDQLIISDQCYDCFMYVYKRK